MADGTSTHERAVGPDRDSEDVWRFLSPRLRRMVGGGDPSVRDERWGTGPDPFDRGDPEAVKKLLAKRLAELPGSFSPVYNGERQRWEVRIG